VLLWAIKNFLDKLSSREGTAYLLTINFDKQQLVKTRGNHSRRWKKTETVPWPINQISRI